MTINNKTKSGKIMETVHVCFCGSRTFKANTLCKTCYLKGSRIA